MAVDPDFDWTCDRCGHLNRRESLEQPRVCVECGYDPRYYEALEEMVDDDRPKGIE